MPIAVRTIRVMRSVRALIGGASSCAALSIASSKPSGSVSELAFVLLQGAARWPIRKEGVPVRPSLLAAWASVVISVVERGLLRSDCPLVEVQTGDLLGEPCRKVSVDVVRALSLLLVVEELDVVPRLFLLARGECRLLLGVERFLVLRRRLQAAVFDPDLASLTGVCDQLRKRAALARSPCRSGIAGRRSTAS